MRNRLERGRLHKAQRGELFHHVSLELVQLFPDRVDMDPDEQVRVRHHLDAYKYEQVIWRTWGSVPLPGAQQHPPWDSAGPWTQPR